MASKSRRRPAGIPSSMTTSPLPCDSPAVRKRSIASSFYTNFLHCFGEDRRDHGLFLQACRLQICVRRMATLVGDRFLCRTRSELNVSATLRLSALDLATGARVRLCIDRAGTRAEQQAWIEWCTRAHAAGGLLDFGFFGSTHRFEARTRTTGLRPRFRADASDAAVEWLEHARPSSSRVLRVEELPDARMLRHRGFVPCDLALLGEGTCSSDVSAALARRSVVVLDWRDDPCCVALGVLRLRQLGVREFGVLARRAPLKGTKVMNAAEGRETYGERARAADPRMAQTIVEAQRLLARGRHAGAERALRAAAAGFERRGDFKRAGGAGVMLGRLLLSRGRAADASTLFTEAHDRFQRARAVHDALDATVYLGLAQTDLAQ